MGVGQYCIHEGALYGGDNRHVPDTPLAVNIQNHGHQVQPMASTAGFVQTLESPGILLFRIPGLESPGKKHRSWTTLEKSWNSKADVL